MSNHKFTKSQKSRPLSAKTKAERLRTQEEVKKTLRGLLHVLEDIQARGNTPPTGSVSLSVKALRRFLSGEVKTLDSAFGLNGPKGYPARKTRDEELEKNIRSAFKLRELQSPPASWKKIADDLKINNIRNFERQYWKRWATLALQAQPLLMQQLLAQLFLVEQLLAQLLRLEQMHADDVL